jgi:ATP-dependent Clp protease adapter protein ClpS
VTRPATVRRPAPSAAVRQRPEDMCQVVLFNDEHNTAVHVVRCLRRVFGHPEALAVKIMIEAHETGRAIAEVEAETPARLHKKQLQSFGLTVEVERIEF